MPGFDNSTMFADNVDFRGVKPVVGQVTTNGQLLIGSTAAPHIKAGSLTSTGGSITITPGSGTINLETTNPGGIVTINGDSGSITGSTVTVFANNATNNSGATVTYVNSGTISTFNVTGFGNSTFVGKQSGNLTVSGTTNNGFGFQSLQSLTSGSASNAFGWRALNGATSGANNSAFGHACMEHVTTSSTNSAFGFGCLQQLTTGTGGNCALGYGLFSFLGSGNYNIGIGQSTGNNYTTTESSNILLSNPGTLGESNTIRIGTQGTGDTLQNRAFMAGIVGVTNTNSQVVTIDSTTGQMGVAGNLNISDTNSGGTQGEINQNGSRTWSNFGTTSLFLGKGSGNLTNTGTSNFGFGTSCYAALTNGSSNSAHGHLAHSALTSGANNSAFGTQAQGTNAVTGANNTSIGYQSQNFLTSGAQNSAIGSQSQGMATVTGSNNSSIGFRSLQFLSSGGTNTSLGDLTMSQATVTGTGNLAAGYQSLQNITSGANNVTLGQGSGTGYTSSESGNIIIGATVAGTTGESNITRIGTGQSAFFASGITGVTVTGTPVLVSATGQLGIAVSSEKFKENIKDLDSDILNLRPVEFTYKEFDNEKHFGFIAEEVEKVNPDLVIYQDNEVFSVKYHEMVPFLLKEIQKLNEKVEALSKKIA